MPTYFLKPSDQKRLGFTKLIIRRERLPQSQGTRYDVAFYDGHNPALSLGSIIVRKVNDGIMGRNWDVSLSVDRKSPMQFEIPRSKTRREALNKLQRDLKEFFRYEYGLKLPIRL